MRKITLLALASLATLSTPLSADGRKTHKTLTVPFVVSSVLFSPDEKWLAVGGMGEIAVYDRRTMKAQWSEKVDRLINGARLGQDNVSALAFTRNSKTLAFLNALGEIRLYESAKGKRISLFALPKRVAAVLGLDEDVQIVFSFDEKQIAIVLPHTGDPKLGGTSGIFAMFDVATGKHLLSHGGVRSVVAKKNGRFLALQTDNNNANPTITNLLSGKTLHRLRGNPAKQVWLAMFSPNGERVALGGEQFVVVWDVKTGKRTFLYRGTKTERFSQGCAFSSDGSRLAVASLDLMNGLTSRIRCWKFLDNEDTGLIALRQLIRKAPRLMGLSPDGCVAAYSSGKRRIELMRLTLE